MNGAEAVVSGLVGIGQAMWRASWQASVLAVLVFLVQLSFGKRISARWRHAMWVLVLVRLALPVVPSSPMSVFNLAPKPVTISTAIVHADGTPAPGAWMLPVKSMPIAAAMDGNTPPTKPPTIQPAGSTPGLWMGWPQVLATLWALGAIGLALRVALATWRVSRTLRRLERIDADASANAVLRATAWELRVRRAPVLLAGDGFFSPALVGCVEPKLIVPRELLDFDRAELRLIFLHELAHLKRRDVAINWAATMLTVLHWLNPVAWLVAWRLRIERELACDELVMSATSDTDRRAYGHTIVKLLETFSRGGAGAAQPLPAGGVGILEGSEQMKRRITMIAQFARSNRMWTAVAALLVVTLGVVALTDAVKAEPPAPAAREPSLQQRTVRMADGTLVTTNDYDAPPAALRRPATGPTTAEVAQSDAEMRDLMHQLYALQEQRESRAGELGPQHPQIAKLDAEITSLKQQMDKRASAFLQQHGQSTKLKVGDLVAVSIMDLVGPGVETVKTARIDGDGKVSMPYVGQIKAAGLTPTELEKVVAGAFKAQSIVDHAIVSVSMPERGESLQMVKRPSDAAPGAPAPAPGLVPGLVPGIVPGIGHELGPEGQVAGGLAPPAVTPEDEATKAVMGRQLPEIKLDSIPLSDTIDFLRDITSTNIFVNWRALEAAGIDRNSPVTLKLKNVAFRDVLSLIARDQGNGMNFKMENGVIVIDVPVQPARARKLTTKTYDVMQLLGNVNDDTLPAKMKNLEEVVRTTVQPMSWQDQSTGISAFQSQLIVTAADEVHAGVEQLLKMLERGDGATTKPSTQRAWFESR